MAGGKLKHARDATTDVPFIGRSEELAWLREAALLGEAVWVSGPLGMGVTSLLRAFAADRGARARLVDLAGVHESGLVGALSSRDTSRVRRRVAAFRGRLRDELGLPYGSVLVVDHADAHLEELDGLIMSGDLDGMCVIVGAVAGPPQGRVSALALEGLMPRDACSLVTLFAGQAGHRVEAGESLVEAVQRLHGNPGLLRQAIPWLTRLAIADAARIYEADPMRFDEGPDGKGAVVWPALYESWRRLPAALQQILYRCAAFEDGFEAARVDAVIGDGDAATVLGQLTMLKRLGWIRSHPLAKTRLEVEATALAYVRDQLGRTGQRARVFADHTQWAGQLAPELDAAAQTGSEDAVAQLHAESQNFLAVTERRSRTARRGADAAVWTCLARATLARIEGDIDAWERALDDADEHAQWAGDEAVRAVAERRAWWRVWRGELDEALAALEPHGLASGVGVRCVMLQGQPRRAEELLSQAFAAAVEPARIASLQLEAARLSWLAGDGIATVQAVHTARGMLGASDIRMGAGDLLALDGILAELDLREATVLVGDAVAARPGARSTLFLRARLALAMRDDAAVEYLDRAARLSTPQSVWCELRSALYRGQYAHDRLQFQRASLAYEAAFDLAERLGIPGILAEVSLWRGLHQYERGELDDAVALLTQAADMAASTEMPRVEGYAAAALTMVGVDRRQVNLGWLERMDGALLACADAEGEVVRTLAHAHMATQGTLSRSIQTLKQAVEGPSTASLMIRSVARLLSRSLKARASSGR